jgi:hypothetical protein
MQKQSLADLQSETQDWYKKDAAEKIAGLTAASLELLLETQSRNMAENIHRKEIIQSFNIIFSQQLLQENIEEIYVLISFENQIYAIEDGANLYNYFFAGQIDNIVLSPEQASAVDIYRQMLKNFQNAEEIYTIEEGGNIYHVFVPLVPNGEYAGSVYIKISPDFSFINREVVSSYDDTAIIFSALILIGLLAMFFISSFTVSERDATQELLFMEREDHLRDQINHQKEAVFTKRIYHTHHKAEKVMGFIKEDLRQMNKENFNELNERVNKYANFVARAIYDIKWYDPPVQTIRGSMFNTDINKVITFLVDNLFKRVSQIVHRIHFRLNLDSSMPDIRVNEYIIWEIVEPLIQNCIDHVNKETLVIKIKTKYVKKDKKGYIYISDNGNGIPHNFLETTETGLKKIFLESISTKKDKYNTGYGCYLAYENARKCGWKIDVENLPDSGSCFSIAINF